MLHFPQNIPDEGNRTMTRSIRSLLLSVAAFAATVSAPIASSIIAPQASAQSFHRLREISDEYRDATVAFERHVCRAKYFDNYDEQLADRLECVAREFHSAAKNPKDVQRLLFHWQDLTATHFRAEEMLVRAHASCDPELLRCWQPVSESFACLAEEMKCYSNHPNSHRGANTPAMGGDDAADFGRFGEYGENDLRSQRLPNYAVPNSYSAPRGYSGHTQGVQLDPRREIGAAIATSILNRLLN